MKQITLLVLLVAWLSSSIPALATETENLGLRVLPAPGKIAVDGRTEDWDLSGGVFACGDVENAARTFAVWFHAMYDAERLYLLARWNDPTPLNHGGSSRGDYGFNGDCLQVRVVTAPDVAAAEVKNGGNDQKDAEPVRTAHLTCWRDRDGIGIIDVQYGRKFNEGAFKDAQTAGAEQAFYISADRQGYVQEIALPWRLLVKPGREPRAGGRIMLTIEPNFTVGTGGRLTIKDLFKPDVPIDRIFTFMGNNCWGFATLEPRGRVTPSPVRLADGREFPVRMENGLPVVDWTGLVKSRLPTGFKPLRFRLPEDGYVSLNLFHRDGSVARQLLTSHFFPKGEHEVGWDGLTTPSVRRPGEPLSPDEYTWDGFYHTGIGLRLRGWAANSGPAPWQGWGADHGNPQAVAAAGDRVFVGWSGGEGDKPLICCDLSGKILWKNIRGGIASAAPTATDGETVFAFNNVAQYVGRAIYRVDAKTGKYTEWTAYKSTDLPMKELWRDADPNIDEKDIPEQPTSLAAANGRVLIGFHKRNVVLVVDAKTGRVTKRLDVPNVGAIAARIAPRPVPLTTGAALQKANQAELNRQILVISRGEVLVVDVLSGESRSFVKPALAEGDWLSAITTSKSGQVFVGVRGRHHQVLMFGPEGQFVRRIGREAGRSLLGLWTPDGMFNVGGLAVGGTGELWVAEDDEIPRRVSVWDTTTGEFAREHFGASSYGATGAVVHPVDPNLLVGQGCEWRIDPQTGRSKCLGVITRDGMGASRFGFGPNGRVYLAVTPTFLHGPGDIRIFERLGDANYKLRSMLRKVERPGESGKKTTVIEVWSDANDDGKEQPDEVRTYAVDLGGWLNGWYMPMTPDLTFYGALYAVKVTSWTPCGAPLYDLNEVIAKEKLPGPDDVKHRGGMGAQKGHGSVDGRFILWNAAYGVDHGTLDCFDRQTGRKVWSYPSNFTGVHGSHRAVPAEVGMLRGAYDVTGAAKLPAPLGNVWVVPTNKGEWHVVTERGFYLTRLFQGDLTKVRYPENAVPGASLDSCPPGAGEEAFGGSITQHTDGRLSVQAGHISYWNCEVTGLDTVRPLTGGSIRLTAADTDVARTWRERYLQEAAGTKRLVVRRRTPTFTGDLDKDFSVGGSEIIRFAKSDATAIRASLAWDDEHLHVGWEVKDATPWINGADAPEFLYARGDTVDLQLGLDPAAPPDRKEASIGDLRISIGDYQAKPAVVSYQRVVKDPADRSPKTFNSGTFKNYEMARVVTLSDAVVSVRRDAVKKLYVVEASLPLRSLGLSPRSGLTLRGDLGATHSDDAGRDTLQRTHWSNQATGLVSDEVFELQMTPAAWGELRFAE